MKILYLLTAPDPAVPGTDAVFQEVSALHSAFPSEVANIFPLRRPTRWYPTYLLGLAKLGCVADWNARFDLFHVYGSVLRPFPFLRLLKKPVVFTVAAGLEPNAPIKVASLHALHTVVVTHERDRERLAGLARPESVMIRPGIDTKRFSEMPPPPLVPPFTVLVGSAPWTAAQFTSKGIVALLEAMKSIPDLRLVFLWRGWHRAILEQLIAERALAHRCDILDGWVDVSQVLTWCHAAVVLAANARLVKAYPHSLLEALAAGRPVLASSTLGIAHYVDEKGCGVVVHGMKDGSVLQALEKLRGSYEQYRTAACSDRARAFGLDHFVEAHRQLYRAVAGSSS
jgi:glycosyltransferase involved in cell wall biosynthesis